MRRLESPVVASSVVVEVSPDEFFEVELCALPRDTRLPPATPEERVRGMFVAAFARVPTEAELQRWTSRIPGKKKPAADYTDNAD